MALITPKLTTILWKTFSCNCGQLFDTNTHYLVQQNNRVPGSAGLPERLQQQPDTKKQELGHGSATWDQFSSIRLYLSHRFILWLGRPHQMTQLVFGTNTAGSCHLLFQLNCIFQQAFRERRSWPIFYRFHPPTSVHNSGCLLLVTHKMANGTVAKSFGLV